jgi:hypothetical protein
LGCTPYFKIWKLSEVAGVTKQPQPRIYSGIPFVSSFTASRQPRKSMKKQGIEVSSSSESFDSHVFPRAASTTTTTMLEEHNYPTTPGSVQPAHEKFPFAACTLPTRFLTMDAK